MHAAFHILVFLLLGILLGAGYFALLFAAVAQYRPGAAMGKAIVPHLARLTVGIIGFWLIAQFGASALFASLAGFTAALVALRPITTS
jgi:N-ATPase, AtpR subunit